MKNQLLTVNPVNPSAERKRIREERKRIREERKKIREAEKEDKRREKEDKRSREMKIKKSTPRSGNSSKCSDLKIISYWFFTQ